MFATSVVPLLAVAGLAIDVGNIFSARRQLQATTDMAAIAAAADLSHATAAATANAVTNGYASPDVSNVELGTYTPDPAIPVSQRFQPGNANTANAVRVTMLHQQPLFFGSVFALIGGSSGGKTASAQNVEAISTQAVAAQTNTLTYTIGSRVASLQGGIENAVLGGLLGGSVQLSAVDYTNLASANVDLFALGKALAVQAGQVGGTYKQAVSASIPLSTFLNTLAAVAPGAASALSQLQQAAQSGGQTVNLSQLISFGPYGNVSLADPEPDTTATVSAMNLVQAAAEIGGASHLVTFSLGAALPGIASVTGMLSLGEPAQGQTAASVNIVGSSVHTSQLRLFLNISLTGTPLLPLVTLPIYVEVGYGTASLAALSCQSLDATTTSATLNVTPGLVQGWIGTVTPGQMANFSTEPTVSPATFVNLGLVTVTGQATATVGNQQAVPVSYTYTDIQNAAVKSSSTTDFTGALVNSLLANTSLQVNGLGAPGLSLSVGAILNAAAGSVDTLLNTVLQTTGVELGRADTWVGGARCGAGLLSG